MARGNHYNCFDRFAIWFIRKKARETVRNVGFVPADIRDLEQELAMDLWRRSSKFDPSRASANTFVARIVNNKVASILKAHRAACRDARRLAEEPSLASLGDVDHEGGSDAGLQEAANDDHERALCLDVRRTVNELAPHERELCKNLSKDRISDVARACGKGRATIYDARARVRDHFERAGLREYLDHSDTSASAPVGINMPIARSRG